MPTAKTRYRMPSIRSVAKWLADIKRDLVYSGELYSNDCDVRLQVGEDGNWDIHVGDPSLDDDHTGYWGAGGITGTTNCRDLARDLIDQAAEQAAQSGDQGS